MKSNNINIRLAVFFFVALAFVGLSILWWRDGTSPVDPTETTPLVFTVSRGQSIRDIATRLSSSRIIRSPIGFYMLVKFLGIERQIQAGEFRLTRSMTAEEIAKTLTHGTLDVWVTLVEGLRGEEIAMKIAKDLEIPEREFLAIAQEGYMFPDTYRFPTDASAAAVAKQMRDNFDKKARPLLEKESAKTALSAGDTLILASIVEREGKSKADRPVIAGILLNRLKGDIALEADATLQYALGYQSAEKTWWKKNLSEEDKLVDSPYNTYKYPGLPPSPICNPGIEAIQAVLAPQRTEYLFYLHDSSGNIHYAKTLDEHKENIEKFLK
jgi:UPF0755 protein